MRQLRIMFPSLFIVYMDLVMEVKSQMGRRGVRLPCLLYADHLTLCGEWEEDLRVIVGRFIEVQIRAK